MKWISQKFVILWDVEDKRGWLVNGTSALLHLVRASLAQDMFDNKFGPLCLFSTKEFQEASRLHQTDAALEVLLNPNNLKAKIYPEEDDFIRFKAYVEDFSDLLEKMLDYQSRVVIQNIPRSLLEGWDFNDMATGRDPIYPREASLSQEGLSWVDFTRSVHAITLFGRSFGEVIQPAKACCSAWAKVPCGRSYLAASATDLYKIMESDGDPYSVPMRLTHDILWYTSKKTFAQCQCNSETDDDTHSDIAQVLLPSRCHRELSGTCSQLPPKSGAVIFGYNNTHRWFWGDTGNPSKTPNESDRTSPFNKGLHGSQFSDSGIGKSLGSSASITDSTSNRLDEEYTGYTHAVNSESEDHQSSSSTYNKRNSHSEGSNVSSPLAGHYKVGIVCALHIELMAVRASFDKTYEKVAIAGEDPNYYALGSIEGHNVVAVCLPHGVYGTNAAADVTSNMKRSFPGLKFCLLVGIGAGVPSQKNDIRLGDVVVSTPKGGYSGVLPYDMIKSTDSGAFELNGYLSPPPAHLMCAISELESDPSRSSTPLQNYLQQIEQCKEQYTYPGVAHDRLFVSHYTHNGDPSNISNCDQCDSTYEIRRPARSSIHPEIHYGLIASGNQVMKSAKIRDKLGREHNVLCFEMEGAGIMNNFPCLIIRGICDYADSHKNKRWQNYAAATAAAYAKLLLSRLRTADGFESEPVERLSRKRTATTERGGYMPAAKRSRG
jgi:nucleoside phosphorylase